MDMQDLITAVPHAEHLLKENATSVKEPAVSVSTAAADNDHLVSKVAPEQSKIPVEDPTPQNSAENHEVVYTILEDHGYFVIEKIGSGSFSKVKKAHSRKENKIVAIKLVSKSRAPKDYLEKFLPREIEVVKGLDHLNIIKYYRCIETTRRVYIIMQYAENGSLLDRIRSESQLEENTARHIYAQLLSALEYCHKRGVVHRDIKCENLLFDKHNVLKLIDFGFARKYQPPNNASAQSSSGLSDTYCGSYAYACPQILSGIPYDPQFADVWASGVVLFAMVFGHLPFDDSSFAKLLKQVAAKLNFSTKGSRQVSELCKSCLNYILARSGNRTIAQIKEHTWMLKRQKEGEASAGGLGALVATV